MTLVNGKFWVYCVLPRNHLLTIVGFERNEVLKVRVNQQCWSNFMTRVELGHVQSMLVELFRYQNHQNLSLDTHAINSGWIFSLSDLSELEREHLQCLTNVWWEEWSPGLLKWGLKVKSPDWTSTWCRKWKRSFLQPEGRELVELGHGLSALAAICNASAVQKI